MLHHHRRRAGVQKGDYLDELIGKYPSSDALKFIPSPTTCFKDDAGTIPCAVGDAVAVLKDESGRGQHAYNTDAATRPILRQNANGVYYLDTDTDLYLYIPHQANALAGDGITASAVSDVVQWSSGYPAIFAINGGPFDSSNRMPKMYYDQAYGLVGNQYGTYTLRGSQVVAGTLDLITSRYTRASSYNELWHKGGKWFATGYSLTDAGSLGGIGVAPSVGGYNTTKIKFYGAFWINKVLTDAEVDGVRNFFSSLTGAAK